MSAVNPVRWVGREKDAWVKSKLRREEEAEECNEDSKNGEGVGRKYDNKEAWREMAPECMVEE